MSAWIVSKAHIDVLVHALGVREMFPEGMDPDAVGTMLWQECHDSVNHRYDESEPCPDYVYTVPPTTWTPSQLVHHIDCYDYQTCEHPTYKESQSYLLVMALRQALIAGGADPHTAPEGTPWGVPECGGDHASWARDCEACTALFAAWEEAHPS